MEKSKTILDSDAFMYRDKQAYASANVTTFSIKRDQHWIQQEWPVRDKMVPGEKKRPCSCSGG